MPYVVERHPGARAQGADWYVPGMPQTILLGGLPARALSGHWSAGAPGRAGAFGTAAFLIAERARNASYHEEWWWEAGTETFGVLELVSNLRAAHSMNPAQAYVHSRDSSKRALEASRFAEVRRLLGPKASDPNAGCYAFSFAGMPADLERALRSPVFRRYAARRVQELRARESLMTDARPLFGHGWIQPSTRYDPGEVLIDAIYGVLYGPQEEDMPKLHYVPQLWRTNTDAELRLEPTLDVAAEPARVPKGSIVFTVGETFDQVGAFRLAVVGDPERLMYLRRSQIDPLPPTPRDAELHAGIAAVVNARAAGQPVPTGGGGVPEAEVVKRETAARSAGAKAAAADVKDGAADRAAKYGA